MMPRILLRELDHTVGSLTGARQHLTVLSCNLVDSTQHAAQLDAEEQREIFATHHRGHRKRAFRRPCRRVSRRQRNSLFVDGLKPTWCVGVRRATTASWQSNSYPFGGLILLTRVSNKKPVTNSGNQHCIRVRLIGRNRLARAGLYVGRKPRLLSELGFAQYPSAKRTGYVSCLRRTRLSHRFRRYRLSKH
jgi:hypothetical protein